MTISPFEMSRRIYASGDWLPVIAVPLRQIEQSQTRHADGTETPNPPILVYDTSGPWGDPALTLDIREGIPPVRRPWILDRGDVAEINGRQVHPQDDGYLSQVHANKAQKGAFPGLRRRPLRASASHPVTQLPWFQSRRGQPS
jgi:phosphomethylpyrimidine synthase